MEKKVHRTVRGHTIEAPYSPAVVCGSLVFVSGQVAYDFDSKCLIPGTFEEEANTALENLRTVLEETGSALSKVVKVTVFLTNIKAFDRVNKVYELFFPSEPPARSCVEVSALPYGAKVEIEAVAHL